MTKITLQGVRKMVKDKSLIKLAEAVFTAMAYEQTIADLVKPKQQEIIDFFKFEVEKEWREKYGIKEKFIKDESQMYLASEEDHGIYMKELALFYTEAGIKPNKKGNCTLLEAESLTRDTKKHFIDALEPYTGISFDDLLGANGLKTYHKYIDLNLGLFSGKVKKELNKAA